MAVDSSMPDTVTSVRIELRAGAGVVAGGDVLTEVILRHGADACRPQRPRANEFGQEDRG